MQRPDVELWYSPGACSLAPHILLRETGLPFVAKPIALSEGEHLTSDYARINPKRRVPVLVVDGWVITEVIAVMAAIAGLAVDRWLLRARGA